MVKGSVAVVMVLLLFQLSLVAAADVKEIGDIFGLPKDQVVVSNVTFTKEKDGVLFLFKEGGSVNVMGNIYDDIEPGGKLKLNFKAIPIEADFVGIGKYKFPEIPEFELKNKTKISFKENILTIFSEVVEELRPAKKLSEEKCRRRYGHADCWEIVDTPFIVWKDEIEELIQKGILKKTDEGLFYVEKYFIAKNVTFYLPSQLNLSVIEDKVEVFNRTFNGSNFKIDEVHVFSINRPSSITVKKEGFFIIGKASYKGTSIDGSFFLNPKDQVNESWIKIDDDFIEAKSKTPLYIAILRNNNIFDVGEEEGEGTLKFTLEQDYIKMTSRKEQNLVPLIQHNGSEKGKTEIETGIFDFILWEGDIQIKKVSLLRLRERMSIQFLPKSVAFELSSNLIEGKRLIVGSGNNYVLSSELAPGAVIMNPWGVPVTNDREYNLLKTVEQLQEKWKDRGIEFKKYATPDPGTVQLVNYWLERRYRPEVKLDRIVFYEDSNAFATEMETLSGEIVMGVGAYIMDPYSVQEFLGETEIRPFDPLKILDHEYQHAQEFYLIRKDYKNFIEKARKIAEERVSPEDYVKLFLDYYKGQAEAKDEEIWLVEILKRYLLEEGEKEEYKESAFFNVMKDMYLDIVTDEKRLSYELPSYLIEKYNLPKKDIRELSFEDTPREAILELADLVINELERSKKFIEGLYNSKVEEFLKNKEKFLKEYEQELSSYKKQVLDEKTKEAIKELDKKEFKQRPEAYIGAVLNEIGDRFLTQLSEDYSYKSCIQKIIKLLSDLALEENPRSEERKALEDAIEKIKNEISPIEILEVLLPFMKKNENLAKEALLLQKEVEKYAPAAYSFRKYPSPIHGERYGELLSTLVELPDEERISRARSYQNYRILEQILFDMDSIFTSPEFYQQIFGKCKRSNCLDKRCIIYKGECCRKFSKSPNC